MNKRRIYGRENQRAWWPHRPEFLRRFQLFIPARTLRLRCEFWNIYKYCGFRCWTGAMTFKQANFPFLLSHFRSLIITIVIYIVFPSGSASKFLINISQFPQSVFFHTIYNPPNTICCQHKIPPLPSLPSLYQITLTQSAVNTQFPHSLPFPPSNQSP